MSEKFILSASRINTFLECSWSYYCKYILGLPDKTHPKTLVGSLVHSILECLSKTKRRVAAQKILDAGTLSGHSAIVRYIQYFAKVNNIDDKLIADVDKLVLKAMQNDFFFSDAKSVFSTEYEFKLSIGEFSIRGFIDAMADYGDYIKIRDYKTASQKPSQRKIDDSIQGFMYQLAVREIFKKPSQVEFNYLRHKKSLLIQGSVSEEALEGFKQYLNIVAKHMSGITEIAAKKNFRAAYDSGFCTYVCQFKDPVTYFVALDSNKKVLCSAKSLEELVISENTVSVEKRHYSGCPFFYV